MEEAAISLGACRGREETSWGGGHLSRSSLSEKIRDLGFVHAPDGQPQGQTPREAEMIGADKVVVVEGSIWNGLARALG